MAEAYEIFDVTQENVDQTGFFCYMSKRKAPGYRQKRDWLAERFAEGMQIKILHETGGRDVGFIEYLPGEYAWRAVNAPGYMVIHCLWVVGKGKGKGYGSQLIEACQADARRQGKHGVVMVSSSRVWLAGKEVFLNNGFEEIDQAPPTFQLLVHRFAENSTTPEPSFPQNWAARGASFGPGLTVVRTPQCPYIENGAAAILKMARARGLEAREVTLHSAREVQQRSPSPYGVFGIVLVGQLLSYHYLTDKDFDKLLDVNQE